MSILISLIGLLAIVGGGLAIAAAGGEGVVAMALGGLLIATGVLMQGFARLLTLQRDAAAALDDIARAVSGAPATDPLEFAEEEEGERPAPIDHVGGRSEPRL